MKNLWTGRLLGQNRSGVKCALSGSNPCVLSAMKFVDDAYTDSFLLVEQASIYKRDYSSIRFKTKDGVHWDYLGSLHPQALEVIPGEWIPILALRSKDDRVIQMPHRLGTAEDTFGFSNAVLTARNNAGEYDAAVRNGHFIIWV